MNETTVLPLSNPLEWSPTALRAKSTLLFPACKSPATDEPALACLSPHLPPSTLDSLSSNHTGLISGPGLDWAVILLRMWVFSTHSWDTLLYLYLVGSLLSFRCPLRSYLLRQAFTNQPHTRHLIPGPFSLVFIACITAWKISSFVFEPTCLLSASYTPTPLQM